MAFDGIVTKQVIQELNTCLIGGKINKIYQPNKNEILFGIYANSKHYCLLVNIDASNCRMHLTDVQKPNPLQAPNFCMLLRKHLVGMRIKSFQTYDLERIVKIVLEGYNDLNDFITKEVVVELMGKHSNIILLNASSKIIDSMRHLEISSNATRDILPARNYTFPTTEKVSFLNINSFEEFYKIITPYIGKEQIDSLLSSHFIGISKSLISYLLEVNQINSNSVLEEDYHIVYNSLKGLISSSNATYVPFSNQEKPDYVVVNEDKQASLEINFFLDDFYNKKETSDEFISYRNSVLKLILNELKKYTKRLNNMNQKLEECNKKEQYRIYGELITANLYHVDANKNLDNITLDNYYDSNNPIQIPLDKTISLSMNAKKYFKKYTKLKNACEIVTIQKQETKLEIDYIESIIYELEVAVTISDIDSIYTEFAENFLGKNVSNSSKTSKKKVSKKKKEEPFSPLSFVIDGYTVLIGRNNKQNDYLTLKHAHSNDLWFHVKDIHGSHIVLKTNGEEIPQEIINKCASICAFYSKAKNSSNVPVDYTFIRYVKKPSGSKPGMVIYTNFQTVNVQPNNFDLC